MPATYYVGDTRQVVASLPTGSVDLVLTSPPFLALRSYLPADHPDKASEIGSEPDPASFIAVMLDLTAEWRRVLAPHGSLAVEFGDTYSGSGGAGGDYAEDGLRAGQTKFSGSARRCGEWPLPKCLTLVPELYRVALAYGRHPLTGAESPAGRWRVRNVVRWVRPNPPVGALSDKFRPATSDLAIACTAADRYFDLDAVRGEPSPNTHARIAKGAKGRTDLPSQQRDGNWSTLPAINDANPAGAPPLDWWQIVPKGYEGSHYATFPPELCVKPIEAMCPRRVCRTCGKPSRRETTTEYEATTTRTATSKAALTVAAGVSQGHHAHRETNPEVERTTTGWTSCGCPGTDGIRLDGFHTGTGWRPGVVLDPFGGTGTTGIVATGHGRDAILIDLDDRNVDLARQRMRTERRIVHESWQQRQRGNWPKRPRTIAIEWLTGAPMVKPTGAAARHHTDGQLHLLDLLGMD
jgi:hypothetical protein